MMAKGAWWWEKVLRGVRTVYFMVTMVASLLLESLPLVVAIGDVVVPCLLIPSFTCVNCYGFREHLRRYAFKSSLMDIPLVSIIRSLIITCIIFLHFSCSSFVHPYWISEGYSTVNVKEVYSLL